MKSFYKILAIVLATVFLVPAAAYAWGYDHDAQGRERFTFRAENRIGYDNYLYGLDRPCGANGNGDYAIVVDWTNPDRSNTWFYVGHEECNSGGAHIWRLVGNMARVKPCHRDGGYSRFFCADRWWDVPTVDYR